METPRKPKYYLVQLADKTSFYIREDEARKAQENQIAGQPVFLRGRTIANHLISQIRPCRFEEQAAAEEFMRIQTRNLAIKQGELKIVEAEGEDGEKKYLITGTQKALEQNYPKPDESN